jgi:hypothetical protein
MAYVLLDTLASRGHLGPLMLGGRNLQERERGNRRRAAQQTLGAAQQTWERGTLMLKKVAFMMYPRHGARAGFTKRRWGSRSA